VVDLGFDSGLAVGEVVGRYVVERPLGAGGMGVVSLARDPELRRAVVIKLVHPNMRQGEGGDELEARLRREAQAMAQVSHTNVVQIFDIGRRGDRVFLAMEYVAGRTFDVWLLEQPRTADEILAMIRQAGAGLAAAHRTGLVHRDFKPGNVLVGHDGIVKVTDFGLARSVTARALIEAGVTRQLRVPGQADQAYRPRQADEAGQAGQADEAHRPRQANAHQPGQADESRPPGQADEAGEADVTRPLRQADVMRQAGQAGVTRPLRGPGPADTERDATPRRPRLSGVHAVITEANSVVGTPAYMAPEQAAGRPIDARCDQYALAVTLLDALLGQSPSRRVIKPSSRPADIDAALEHAQIEAPVRAALIVALSDDPRSRFPTIDELLAALSPPAPAPQRSRRRTILVAGVGVAALGAVAVAGSFATRRSEPPVCVAEAPARWTGEPRERVVAALSAVPRPFAAWEAERIVVAIDGAVDRLAAAELGLCRGTPIAGTAGTPDCIASRTTALTAAVTALSATPPPEDPGAIVRTLESCDAATATTATLREELRGASPARAREIAAAARTAGDDLLAADAFEAAGLAALATGDADAASADLLAMSAAAERAGNDAARARALLHLLDVARWRGDHGLARRDLDELHAILARHRDAPRDQLTVALAEAAAFTDLGDVAIAFAAWHRARSAADTLGDHDAALTAALGRAWSTHVLRFDLARARREATAGLAAGTSASPSARAAALVIAADLAIAERDGDAALTALAEAHRLAPARTDLLADRIRLQRGRALLGQVDDVIANLLAIPSDDPLATARIAIAHGKLLAAADRPGDAAATLESVERDLRGYGRSRKPIAVPIPERIDFALTLCEAQVAAAHPCRSYQVDAMLKGLHPRAPARARFAIAQAASASLQQYRSLHSQHLVTALDILVDAAAEPIQIASLRWQIAQLGFGGLDHRTLATLARDAFRAGGHTAEVADIDAWLSEQPISRPGAAPPGPPKRDPWGPQP
jgi:eukaryotic-like serine/threonine-protein kinase